MERSLCCSSYHPHCFKGRRYRTLGALQPRTPSHSRGARKGPKRMGSNAAPFKPLQDKAHPPTGSRQIILTVLLVTILLDPGAIHDNLHQPAKITWKLQDGLTREVPNLITEVHPLNTWWPDLYFDLKPVVGVPWARGFLRMQGFWACPGHQRTKWKTCGGAQDYFCKSWDCVTSDDGPRCWEVGNRDLLNFSFAKPTPRALGDPTFECEESCNYAQVKIRFNRKKGKKERAWISGLSWGIQTRTVAGTQIYRGIIIISQILEQRRYTV